MNLTPEERERKLARRRELSKTPAYREAKRRWRQTAKGRESRRKEQQTPRRKEYTREYQRKWNKTEKGRISLKRRQSKPSFKKWRKKWQIEYYKTESYRQYRERFEIRRRRLRWEARLERKRADNMLRAFLYKIRLREYEEWLKNKGKDFVKEAPQLDAMIKSNSKIKQLESPWLKDLGNYN